MEHEKNLDSPLLWCRKYSFPFVILFTLRFPVTKSLHQRLALTLVRSMIYYFFFLNLLLHFRVIARLFLKCRSLFAWL